MSCQPSDWNMLSNTVKIVSLCYFALQWCHNECDSMSNHRRFDRLLNHSFRHRSKKTSKLRTTGLREWIPLVTSGFPSQRYSKVENVWSHTWSSDHYLNQWGASLLMDKGLAPNRRQAIIWTNDGLVYWGIYRWFCARLHNSTANTLELLQSCIKPSICVIWE